MKTVPSSGKQAGPVLIPARIDQKENGVAWRQLLSDRPRITTYCIHGFRWRVSSAWHAPGTIYGNDQKRTGAVGQNNRRFHCAHNDSMRAAPQTPADYHYCVDNRELFVIENHPVRPTLPRGSPLPLRRPLFLSLWPAVSGRELGNRAISVIRWPSARVNTANTATVAWYDT